MLIFKNQKLGTKLNLILVGILIMAIATSSFFLSKLLESKIEQEVADKAFLIVETMNSVRNYTSSQVTPELAPYVADKAEFVPQTVPTYSSREVFAHLKQKPEYQNFFYKDATLNPTNLEDLADEFEAKITNEFRQNPQLKEKTGFRTDGDEKFYYVARPLEIKKATCIRCHDTPERAPANLVSTYGTENGFGWKVNEIVASQVVSIPANDVYTAAKKLKLSVLGIVGTIFLLAIALINLFLKRSIIQPIKKMAMLSNDISTGDLELQFKHDSKDEIGILAKSLNRMIESLKMAFRIINDGDDDD